MWRSSVPTCQYVYKGDLRTQNIVTPKQISQPIKWYRGAMKAIPTLPDLKTLGVANNQGWICHYHEINVKWLKFELSNKLDERAVLVILR